jgi:hypothetical protein
MNGWGSSLLHNFDLFTTSSTSFDLPKVSQTAENEIILSGKFAGSNVKSCGSRGRCLTYSFKVESFHFNEIVIFRLTTALKCT